MFLKNIIRDRPQLIEAATSLHQSGAIKPNTWVMDLDLIAENARHIASNAKDHGLTTFLMTKQYNRNPLVTQVALASGLDSTVAVDVSCAKAIHRYGIQLGHVGHLCQVPKGEMLTVLSMKPDYLTVYSVENARFASDAALQLGLTQKILLKSVDHGDLFFPGQESGIWFDQLGAAVKEILSLQGLEIVGLTAFPCVRYHVDGAQEPETTPNLDTLLKAKSLVEGILGRTLSVINAPGNTSSATLATLSARGVTIVEPGHGLTGTTPEHIYWDDLPERAAMVYVSEVSHHFEETAYAFGGGLYICLAGGPLGYPVSALVGRDGKQMVAEPNLVRWHQVNRDNIDYYAMLRPGHACTVGDTVLFGFRAQSFVTRAYTAAVSGISTGNPVVEGIFDPAGHMVDAWDVPESIDRVKAVMAKLKVMYGEV